MELPQCPTCGSDLECREGLTATYCVSTECGAVFHDIRLDGVGSRLADPSRAAREPTRRPRPGRTHEGR